MNERHVCELLMERYGPLRARTLFGALRMLTLFGEDEVRRRGWLSASGLETIRRDLRLAGVPWPPLGNQRDAGRQGE